MSSTKSAVSALGRGGGGFRGASAFFSAASQIESSAGAGSGVEVASPSLCFGRGGAGCARRGGGSWLGNVAGSVASTEISASQLRHFTVTTLPDTLRRNRSSPSKKRELQAAHETVKGISKSSGPGVVRLPVNQLL